MLKSALILNQSNSQKAPSLYNHAPVYTVFILNVYFKYSYRCEIILWFTFFKLANGETFWKITTNASLI